jgi:DNA-binding LacI/PurR family transcriptional regulator
VAKKSDLVYHGILSRLEEGFWKPGNQIYSERQLAELYGVSRITVKQAISELVGEGYLEYLDGRTGTFVVQKNKSNATAPNNGFVVIALDNVSPAFASFLLEGIHDALWEKKFLLTYCNTMGQEPIVERIRDCLKSGAKGLIFSPLLDAAETNKTILEMAETWKIPVIQVDRFDERFDTSVVQGDNYRSMYDLGKKLLEKGYVSPLLIDTDLPVSSTKERRAGICDSFGEQHIPVSIITIDELGFVQNQTVTITKRESSHETHDVIIGVNGVASAAAVQLAKGQQKNIATAGISSSERESVNDFVIIQSLSTIGYDAGMLLAREIKNHPAPPTRMYVRGKFLDKTARR